MIKIVKFVCGDEVLADIESFSRTAVNGQLIHMIRLDKPCVLVPTARGTAIINYPRGAIPQVIEVRSEQVILIADASEYVINGYNEFINKISIPSKPELVLL